MGAPGERLPDAPHPEDPDLRPGDIAAHVVPEPPATKLAGSQTSFGAWKTAYHRQHQAERDIGRCLRQHTRRVREDDLALTAGGKVEVVVADARVGDDLQPWGLIE